MKEIGRYDSSLQMFVEAPRALDTNKLLFHRWLVENRRSEHPAEGYPAGDVALAMVIQSNEPIQKITDRIFNRQELGQH